MDRNKTTFGSLEDLGTRGNLQVLFCSCMSGAGLLLLLELGEMSVAHAVMWRKACATMAHDSLQLEVMKPQKPEPGKKLSLIHI